MTLPPPAGRIPVNVITGFLGAGKTSTILSLLENKPEAETWAVLVNEFGQIGVDQYLMRGHPAAHDRVDILEVPGGCMGCASALPLQLALSQLLFVGNPDRLLIEPTGLGHPIEVLQTLCSDHYRERLELQATVTLVDARQLSQHRHTLHDSFVQQLAVADVVLANKADLYGASDFNRLECYVKALGRPSVALQASEHGRVDLQMLTRPSFWTGETHHTPPLNSGAVPTADHPLPKRGYTRANNAGEGFESMGWRFSPDNVFDYGRTFSFLSQLDVERMKAVFITEKGIYGYNLSGAVLSEVEIDDCLETRVEIITREVNTGWEAMLLDCLLNDADRANISLA